MLGDHHTAGHSASQPLRHGHHIRLDPVLLVAVPGPGTSHPRLHLIENQQSPAGIGDFPKPLEKPFRRQIDTTLALDRLNQDRTGLRTGHVADSIEIVEGNVVEAGHQWPHALVILGLSSRGGGTERSAVETVVEGNDAVPAGFGTVQTHQFQCALDRFGTTVAEERLAESSCAQRLGKVSLWLGVPGVGNVDQFRGLFLQGGNHPGWTVAQDVATPTGKQVQVLVPLGVPDQRPLTTNQADRIATVIGNHVLLELRNRLFTRTFGRNVHHVLLPLKPPACHRTISVPTPVSE